MDLPLRPKGASGGARMRANKLSGDNRPRQAGHALAFAIAFLLMLLAAPHADAQDKIALVVGAARYEHVKPLNSPANDANAVADALRSIGFKIVRGAAVIDPSRDDLNAALKEFRDAQTPGSMALFYFSGHGVEVGGENFLVPVNANYKSPDDKAELWSLNDVVDKIRNSQAKYSILIIDACRNDPFSDDKGVTRKGGLANVNGLPNMYLAFATEPGKTASDGPPNGHSIYTRVLLNHIVTPNLQVHQIFNFVGKGVWEATSNIQLPYQVTTFGVADQYLFPRDRQSLPAEPVAVASLGPIPMGNSKQLTAVAAERDLPRALELAKLYITTFEPFNGEALHEYSEGLLDRHVIGYGRTTGVKAGDRTTPQAEAALIDAELVGLNKVLNETAPGDYSAHQRAALLSFIHSIGEEAWKTSSARAYLQSVTATTYDPHVLSGHLADWTKVIFDGEQTVSPRLSSRRSMEAFLFHTGQPSTSEELQTMQFIKEFEGLNLKVANDATGFVIVGYGHLLSMDRTYKAPFSEITEFQANEYLANDIAPARAAVLRLVKVPLTSQQVSALTSFVFNVGSGTFQRSTLLKQLNEADYLGASEQLRRWSRAGGQVLPALQRRRQMELNLFVSAIPAEIISAGQGGDDQIVADWVKENAVHRPDR
jgi:GH24 family phage-related lysozyme (muramidase)